MNSVIEPLRKSAEYIEFGWKAEDGAAPTAYKVYVGETPDSATMILLAAVSATPMKTDYTSALGKVFYKAQIANVQAALGISTTLNFSNLLLYFTITYVEGGTESSIALSTVVEVPPVGIGSKIGKDDPTVIRHPFVWSDDLQRWHKQAGSSRGAIATDAATFYRINEIQEFTRDSSGNVLTLKAYLSDATLPGSYAKLVTYDYTNTFVSKITVTDSTV